MRARLSTLARRWNVRTLSAREVFSTEYPPYWDAVAHGDEFLPHRCINGRGDTRAAALFLLKAAIDDARKPLAEAA